MRYPFTLYKVKSKIGIMWHARIWDETLQRYAHSKTTGVLVAGKKENRREAEEAARKLCDEFSATLITTTEEPTKSVQQNSPKQEQQLKPTASIIKTVANTPLIDYLSNFWTAESEYAQYKRDVKNNALTPYYIKMNHDDIRRHVEPFPGFQNITVGNLSKGLLKRWLIWLAGRRKTRTKKDGTKIDEGTISGRRANSVLQAVRVAVRGMACLRFLTLHVSAYNIRTYIHKSDFIMSKNGKKVKNFVDHFVDHFRENRFEG